MWIGWNWLVSNFILNAEYFGPVETVSPISRIFYSVSISMTQSAKFIKCPTKVSIFCGYFCVGGFGNFLLRTNGCVSFWSNKTSSACKINTCMWPTTTKIAMQYKILFICGKGAHSVGMRNANILHCKIADLKLISGQMNKRLCHCFSRDHRRCYHVIWNGKISIKKLCTWWTSIYNPESFLCVASFPFVWWSFN